MLIFRYYRQLVEQVDKWTAAMMQRYTTHLICRKGSILEAARYRACAPRLKESGLLQERIAMGEIPDFDPRILQRQD
jgi:hypothetical protein